MDFTCASEGSGTTWHGLPLVLAFAYTGGYCSLATADLLPATGGSGGFLSGEFPSSSAVTNPSSPCKPAVPQKQAHISPTESAFSQIQLSHMLVGIVAQSDMAHPLF